MTESSNSQPSLSGSSGRRLSGGKKRRTSSRRARSSESASNRRVSSSRLLFLLFSAALSAAVLLVLSSSDNRVYVVRFQESVPALSLVGGGDLEAAPIPESAIEPETFSGSDPEELISQVLEFISGKWLVVPVGDGQQLRSSMFSAAGELGEPLAPNERLVSISSPAPQSVAGRIRTGDRVDVYVASSSGLSGMLGQNIEVVSVSVVPSQFDSIASQQLSRPGEGFDDIAPSNPVPGTYVIRVPADKVVDYVSADVSGRIYLILRGPGASDTVTRPSDLTTIICSQSPSSPACSQVSGSYSFKQSDSGSEDMPEGASSSESVVDVQEDITSPSPAAPEGGASDGDGAEN